MITRTFLGRLTLVALLALGAGRLEAQEDFLRGDVNDDEEVTISDVYALVGSLLGSLTLPDCADAQDVDANGNVNVVDVAAQEVLSRAVWIFRRTVSGWRSTWTTLWSFCLPRVVKPRKSFL